MLKVVGASWLQTRISSYILVSVALLGIGAIILGEFGHVEQDGTYSATVLWNHKGGYRIDFWGQGNDLTAVPLHAARAYYKTGIFQSGWSLIEIETSSNYPDTVQAYAAGLLEGSLTWQLIHHHWHNTVKTVCEERADECRNISRYLRENTALIRDRAKHFESTDPFWHMVRLFYAQLDGLEAGWKFAVRRSRQSVTMESQDFLWLAMALNIFEPAETGSTIFLKAFSREGSNPLYAIAHNTVGSYRKMLRLLKKYTFRYHMLPTPKTPRTVPGRSIVMSSYPGALSSQDEFYLTRGENSELIVLGTPNNSSRTYSSIDDVMLPVRTMAANRLATDGQSWFQTIYQQINSDTDTASDNDNGNGGSTFEWITVEPRKSTVLLLKRSTTVTVAINITDELTKNSFLSYPSGLLNDQEDYDKWKTRIVRSQENATTFQHFCNIVRDQLTYRGDLEAAPIPFGVIDRKILALGKEGLETFEATSGPVSSESKKPFKWSETFTNISHIGQPDTFQFDSVTPQWVWT